MAVTVVARYAREGIWITHAHRPAATSDRPPLLFVHSGGHASWCWENLLPSFAERGWECIAFDWYGHGRSAPLDPAASLTRRIADVATEIGIAAEGMRRAPVLFGHSMGGGACLAYAAAHDVAALVLVASVVPAGLGAPPVELPPPDPGRLFGPMPFDLARRALFTSLDEATARRYHARLCPESPQLVLDATRWRLHVDLNAIDAEALVLAGERDMLCPRRVVERLARALDADYAVLPGSGHDDPLLHDGTWQLAADRIDRWLSARFDS